MSGPDKQDYEPTEAEKASASVALANYKKFKRDYEPVLLDMRDKAAKGDPSQILRARGNADTMQALTQPNYRMAQSPDYGANLSKAYQGQLGLANQAGKKIQNTMGSNVLGIARKQEADATTGMSKLSRLATSEALTKAKADQQVAQAKVNAGVQLGSAFAMQGLDNLDTGGTFFTPNERMPYGQSGPPKQISSVSDRWNNFWRG
tara:strand:- start:18739 stop:19353 length:615 start_codon:yes stop_codon:yes gene_type:complete